MSLWIEKLEAVVRRLNFIWADGALVADAILITSLISIIIGSPLIATSIAQLVKPDATDFFRPTAAATPRTSGKTATNSSSSLPTPAQLELDRQTAAEREFRRQAALR